MYSICVPVYNEEESIINITNDIIGSDLWKQSNEKELILCLNGCTDKSEEIANSLAESNPFIKTIIIKEKSKHLALNRFLEEHNQKSDILFFIDADIIFDGNILKKLKDCLEKNKEITIAGATSRYYPEKLRPWDLFKKRILKGSHPKQTFIHGRCYAVKSQYSKELILPDSNVLYEDIYLTIKFRGRFIILDDAIVYAKVPGFIDAIEQTIRDKIAYTALRQEISRTNPELVQELDKNRKEKDKRNFWWTKSKIIKFFLHVYTDYQYKKILKNKKFEWKKLKSTKWKRRRYE